MSRPTQASYLARMFGLSFLRGVAYALARALVAVFRGR
jgi:hypothetical protein